MWDAIYALWSILILVIFAHSFFVSMTEERYWFASIWIVCFLLQVIVLCYRIIEQILTGTSFLL